MNKLTAKRESFAQAYVRLGNKSEAYRFAYNTSKMKAETIHSKACLLALEGNVKARIAILQEEVRIANKVTIDELVQCLAGMVRFDIAELYDEGGRLKNIHEMSLPARQMISQLDTEELFGFVNKEKMQIGQVKKVRTIQKLDAIEKLMKHLGAYEKDNAQKVSIPLEDSEARNARIAELKRKLAE